VRTLVVGDLVLRTILSREGLHNLSPGRARRDWKPLKAYRWETRGTSPTRGSSTRELLARS
jgi:hypothetical protein